MAALGSLFATLHAWVATAAAVVASLLVFGGVLDGLGAVHGRRWLDRLLIVLLILLGVALVLGPGIVVGLRPPSDPLHYVYAVLAVAALPAGRYVAGRRGSSRIGWWVAAGGIITLAALYRLWVTGG
jgi:hypothetical protein